MMFFITILDRDPGSDVDTGITILDKEGEEHHYKEVFIKEIIGEKELDLLKTSVKILLMLPPNVTEADYPQGSTMGQIIGDITSPPPDDDE